MWPNLTKNRLLAVGCVVDKDSNPIRQLNQAQIEKILTSKANSELELVWEWNWVIRGCLQED